MTPAGASLVGGRGTPGNLPPLRTCHGARRPQGDGSPRGPGGPPRTLRGRRHQMSTDPVVAESEPAPAPEELPRYSRLRLTAGVLGRPGCGSSVGASPSPWYRSSSGGDPSSSRAARWNLGSTSATWCWPLPRHDPSVLLGHVAVFTDPAPRPRQDAPRRRDEPRRHDETKGDANPTADSAQVTVEDVQGLGRLLVGSSACR